MDPEQEYMKKSSNLFINKQVYISMVQIMNPLENAIGLLGDFGFFSVVLPFLLVYSLIYGLLTKTEIFGDKDDTGAKSVNQVIALAIGAFVITSTDVVNLMIGIIPQASFLLVVILMLMMMAALMGLKMGAGEGLFGMAGGGKTLFGIITLVFLMIIDAGVEGGIPIVRQINELVIGSQPFLLQGEALSTILGLGFVIGIPMIIIYWLSK